jgi:hypothetical protein
MMDLLSYLSMDYSFPLIQKSEKTLPMEDQLSEPSTYVTDFTTTSTSDLPTESSASSVSEVPQLIKPCSDGTKTDSACNESWWHPEQEHLAINQSDLLKMGVPKDKVENYHGILMRWILPFTSHASS